MWEICLVGTTPVDWVMEWGSKFYVRRYLLWKKYMVFEVGLTEFEGKVKFGETKKYDSA